MKIIHRSGGASAMFSFKGRISRSEYWYRLILQPIAFIIVTIALGGVFSALGVVDVQKSILFNIVGSALWLGFLIAFLAFHWRRWHDLGMSGWWTLANFIPLVGLIAFFVCGCVRGDAGPNVYGSDPLLEPETAP
jgi:uncharacterized membrane protein YhaH (DUF805 family)